MNENGALVEWQWRTKPKHLEGNQYHCCFVICPAWTGLGLNLGSLWWNASNCPIHSSTRNIQGLLLDNNCCSYCDCYKQRAFKITAVLTAGHNILKWISEILIFGSRLSHLQGVTFPWQQYKLHKWDEKQTSYFPREQFWRFSTISSIC